jgi:hypothetical protein
VRIKRPKRAVQMPSVHSLRTDALRHLPRLRVRGRRAHSRSVRAPRPPKAMLRAVTKAERLFEAATASAARARRRARESLTVDGWDVEFSNTDKESATMTVHRGDQSFKLTMGAVPEVGQCPDDRGEVKGKAPFIFNVDGEWKVDKAPKGWPEASAKPARAFAHVTSALHVTSVSHDDDAAHLVDYDVRGKDLEHIQTGLKDARGKVLATNPPTVATMTLRADHVKPNPGGGDGAWDRDLLARTYFTSHLTNMTIEDLHGPILKWAITVEGLGRSYQDVEAAHWQKDCLDIAGSVTPAKLRSSQHGQVLVTGVTAKGGMLTGPVPLTMTVHAGAVSPASTTWSGAPVILDYTAPASREWEGEGVTVHAVSKMGAASQTFAFAHDVQPPTVRITSRITRSFAPYGGATFDVESTIPLHLPAASDAPPVEHGTAPLTWNAFDYHDDGEEAVCQTGSTGVTNFDGVGADPGAIQVTDAFGDEATVKFTITPPVEHYVNDTFFDHSDPATCDDDHYTSDETLWFLGVSVLDNQPDVKIDDPSSPTTWTVGGFQVGTGDVVKYRDLDYGEVHMRIELIQAY